MDHDRDILQGDSSPTQNATIENKDAPQTQQSEPLSPEPEVPEHSTELVPDLCSPSESEASEEISSTATVISQPAAHIPEIVNEVAAGGNLGATAAAEDEDDSFEASEENDDDSGEETDVEDNLEQVQEMPFPGTYVRRLPNPDLPDTVTALTTQDGGKVYIVGTAHFSTNSQDDVTKTVQLTQPDVVLVELCSSRVGILSMDEDKLMEEAKNINFDKFRSLAKQAGMVQGIVHILLLSMSAHLTKQLGMAPGGEFRRAFLEARNIPGCRMVLGDRPVGITLRRAVGSLSWWQKVQLMWCLLTSKDPISKEEVEKCKQRDLLEEMMREMAGEFPALNQVFVRERDVYLAHTLRVAARPIPDQNSETGVSPSVVVGVVGMGHVQGIVENWDIPSDISTLLTVPETSRTSRAIKWTLKAAIVGLISWGCLKIYNKLPLPQITFL